MHLLTFLTTNSRFLIFDPSFLLLWPRQYPHAFVIDTPSRLLYILPLQLLHSYTHSLLSSSLLLLSKSSLPPPPRLLYWNLEFPFEHLIRSWISSRNLSLFISFLTTSSVSVLSSSCCCQGKHVGHEGMICFVDCMVDQFFFFPIGRFIEIDITTGGVLDLHLILIWILWSISIKIPQLSLLLCLVRNEIKVGANYYRNWAFDL